MAAVLRRLLVLSFCGVLAACVTSHPPQPDSAAPWEQRRSALDRLSSWQVDGRAAVSLTQSETATAAPQGWQASLSWHEKDASAEVRLAGPLGMGAVVLVQTARGVSLNGAAPSDDVMAQIQERLGFAPPLESLRFWLLGVPDPSAAFELTRNPADRALQLIQSGWTIDYDRYMSLNGDVLPAHLILSREGVRVRIVIDHWSGLR